MVSGFVTLRATDTEKIGTVIGIAGVICLVTTLASVFREIATTRVTTNSIIVVTTESGATSTHFKTRAATPVCTIFKGVMTKKTVPSIPVWLSVAVV